MTCSPGQPFYMHGQAFTTAPSTVNVAIWQLRIALPRGRVAYDAGGGVILPMGVGEGVQTPQLSIDDLLALIVVHTVFHAGEISALKGVQGVQGITF